MKMQDHIDRALQKISEDPSSFLYSCAALSIAVAAAFFIFMGGFSIVIHAQKEKEACVAWAEAIDDYAKAREAAQTHLPMHMPDIPMDCMW